MSQFTTPISKGGQITLPAEVRRALGVKLGENVRIILEGDHVTVRPVMHTARSLSGSINLSIQGDLDYKAAVAEAWDDRADEIVEKMNRR